MRVRISDSALYNVTFFLLVFERFLFLAFVVLDEKFERLFCDQQSIYLLQHSLNSY